MPLATCICTRLGPSRLAWESPRGSTTIPGSRQCRTEADAAPRRETRRTRTARLIEVGGANAVRTRRMAKPDGNCTTRENSPGRKPCKASRNSGRRAYLPEKSPIHRCGVGRFSRAVTAKSEPRCNCCRILAATSAASTTITHTPTVCAHSVAKGWVHTAHKPTQY